MATIWRRLRPIGSYPAHAMDARGRCDAWGLQSHRIRTKSVRGRAGWAARNASDPRATELMVSDFKSVFPGEPRLRLPGRRRDPRPMPCSIEWFARRDRQAIRLTGMTTMGDGRSPFGLCPPRVIDGRARPRRIDRTFGVSPPQVLVRKSCFVAGPHRRRVDALIPPAVDRAVGSLVPRPDPSAIELPESSVSLPGRWLMADSPNEPVVRAPWSPHVRSVSGPCPDLSRASATGSDR